MTIMNTPVFGQKSPFPWWGVWLLLFLVCLATYANSLHNEFMIDDHGLILESTVMHHPKHILKALMRADHADTQSLAHYRPVSDAMRILLYYFFGQEPTGYRLVNIFLISIFGALAALFIFILTKDAYAAVFTGLAAIVHPINTMAVNYITAHEVILFGIFGLLSMISFMGFLSAPGPSSRRGFYVLSVLFFILSFLTQEIMMMLPVYIFLVFVSVRAPRPMDIIRTFSVFAVIAIGYIFWRMNFASIKTGLLYNVLQFDISFWEYLASLAALIGWYVSKLIFPHEIIFLWSMSPLSGPVVAWALGIAGAVGVSALLYIRKAEAWVKFAVKLFVIGLLPVTLLCFIYPPMGLIIEPHWFFVPSLGYFMFVGLLLSRYTRRFPPAGIIALILLAAWMAKTIGYNRVWRTQESYCLYWLKLSPNNHGPNFWLAHSYLKKGQYDLAQEYFHRALVGGFMDWQVYLNLGIIAYVHGDDARSQGEYKKALSLNPRSGVVYNNLGLLSQRQQDEEQAKRYFTAALEKEPYLLEPRWNLAELHQKHGDWEGALKYAQEAFDLDPRQQQTIYLLMKGYLLTGKDDNVQYWADRFLVYGDNSAWLVDLANLLAQRSFYDSAQMLYRKALEVDPTNKTVYQELGKFFGNTGRLHEAIGVWEYGLSVAPEDEELSALIRQARDLLGKD